MNAFALFHREQKNSWLVLATLVPFLFKKNKKGIPLLFIYTYVYMQKVMATCCILAWKIPWTEETSGLQSIQLRRAEHN